MWDRLWGGEVLPGTHVASAPVSCPPYPPVPPSFRGETPLTRAPRPRSAQPLRPLPLGFPCSESDCPESHSLGRGRASASTPTPGPGQGSASEGRGSLRPRTTPAAVPFRTA